MSGNLDLLTRGQAALGVVEEGAPELRAATAGLREQPSGALARLSALLKDLWAKISDTGFITAVVQRVKALFSAAGDGAKGGVARLTERAAAVKAALPVARAAGEEGVPLLSGSGQV